MDDPVVLDICSETTLEIQISQDYFTRGEFEELEKQVLLCGAELASFIVVGWKILLTFKTEDEENADKVAVCLGQWLVSMGVKEIRLKSDRADSNWGYVN